MINDKFSSKLFIAGAKEEEGKLLTTGGRVLNVVAIDSTLEGARAKAYNDMKNVNFEGLYYRKDIGEIK